MVTKSESGSWSGKKTFGLYSLLSFAAGAGATKTILDFVRPDANDNLSWAMGVGLATGVTVGALVSTGILNIRFLTPRKKVIQV